VVPVCVFVCLCVCVCVYLSVNTRQYNSAYYFAQTQNFLLLSSKKEQGLTINILYLLSHDRYSEVFRLLDCDAV
jgi:hypothetical protein